MKKYIPSEIEPKWRKKWEESFPAKIDLSKAGRKFYLLVEFTYPSGDLHMGHWFAFAVPDILSRMKRMQGYTVFAPNGFDAFGLPAENAAISRKIHPSDWTYGNIKKMKQQFETMGAIYDWGHEVITCDPEYYRWNQWIFLKMYEGGLAYRAKALANWCPKDQCVLANENVENGKCWRCGSEVVQKEVEQWFLKITDYADKLIWDDKKTSIEWPKPLKEGQNNWIGKSEGLEINFRVDKKPNSISVFTKFPETIFGVTYMVLAPEHPVVAELLSGKFNPPAGGESSKLREISDYVQKARRKSELERITLEKEKTGVFTGLYCVIPVNEREVPIWIADYVIATYGTGAVMGVPGSDVRDFQFAKKYKLPMVRVIGKFKGDKSPVLSEADVLEDGFVVNSGQFDGLVAQHPAKEKFMDYLEEEGWGKRKVNYHLRDWSISRQRYWGTPIPIIYCDTCGTVPVPEKDLPVELPYKRSLRSSSRLNRDCGPEVDFAPHGKPPLATAEDWVRVKCPNCAGEARREVETMDTFVDSSWYFLRYLDPKNDKEVVDKKLAGVWMPVDIYFGGAEHTLGHTLYSRFFVKFLEDIGVVPKTSEYAAKRVHHGVILGSDGRRMSKSRGNVVNPDDEVKQYGADAVRLYLAFLGPYDLVAPWDPGGVRGVYHFLERVWKLVESVHSSQLTVHSKSKSVTREPKTDNLSAEDLRWMHKTIKKVTEDIESIKFNTAVSTLMEWLNHLSRKVHSSQLTVHSKKEKRNAATVNREPITLNEFETFLKLVAPFAPHITEELWEMMGEKGSIHRQGWPKFDPKLVVAKQVTIVVQVNGKLRDKLLVEAGTAQNEAEKLALGSEKVQKFLGNKKPRKVIFVLDRLINFVV